MRQNPDNNEQNNSRFNFQKYFNIPTINTTRERTRKILIATGFSMVVGSTSFLVYHLTNDDAPSIEAQERDPRVMNSGEIMKNNVNSYAHFFLEMK